MNFNFEGFQKKIDGYCARRAAPSTERTTEEPINDPYYEEKNSKVIFKHVHDRSTLANIDFDAFTLIDCMAALDEHYECIQYQELDEVYLFDERHPLSYLDAFDTFHEATRQFSLQKANSKRFL